MLLTSLLKTTPKEHVDFENLEKSLEEISKVTVLVNENKKIHDIQGIYNKLFRIN
jgi:hypothetical protein